jgi:hypothetical protein
MTKKKGKQPEVLTLDNMFTGDLLKDPSVMQLTRVNT